MADCELIDLEDLKGHKGYQWFLARAAQEWGADAVMARIELAQNTAGTDAEARKSLVDQLLISRRAVAMVLGLVDAEIQQRRRIAAERPDPLAAQNRRGVTL